MSGASAASAAQRAVGLGDEADLLDAAALARHHHAPDVLVHRGPVTAHVDFLRVGTIRPLGPERTLLTIDWLFAPETLAGPGFDLANAVEFVAQVIDEDAMACEMTSGDWLSTATARER